MKMKKERKVRGYGGPGGMCTKNGSYCVKEKRSGGGGQGKCERRSEAFVKIHLGGGGGVGWGSGFGESWWM